MVAEWLKMMVNFLTIWFLLVQVFIFETSGKPQVKSCDSYNYKGYRCVKDSECLASKCFTGGNTDVGKLDIRDLFSTSDPCEDKEQEDLLLSTCPDVRANIETEEIVCCNDKYVTSESGEDDDDEDEEEPILPLPKDYKCGFRNGQIDPRNLIQSVTGANEWPHMCAIFKNTRNGTKGSFLAGGSLIAPGIILTAAHRAFDTTPNDLVVRCRVFSISTSVKDFEEASVKSISIHPAFDEASLRSDFALLHLSHDFVLSNELNPICLPKLHTGEEELDDQKCVATGWGKDSKGDHSRLSETLRQVEIPIVATDSCQATIRDIKGKDFVIHSSFICAGGIKNLDTCEGDGGGPLVCPRSTKSSDKSEEDQDDNEKTFVQVGIVAWGIGCGAQNVPGVYASTQYGLCFIDWATKCVHGKKYTKFYDYKDCQDWAVEEREKYENQIRRLRIAAKGQKSQAHLDYINKELPKLEKAIKSLDKLEDSCNNKGSKSIADVINIRKNNVPPSQPAEDRQSSDEEEDLDYNESDVDAVEERSIFSDLTQ